jgi:hypothetical protein
MAGLIFCSIQKSHVLDGTTDATNKPKPIEEYRKKQNTICELALF